MIVDSSALAAIFLHEDKGLEVLQAIKRERSYTLELGIKETLNAAWKRRSTLGDDGLRLVLRAIVKAIDAKLIELLDQEPFLERGLSIAAAYGITIYDSLFISATLIRNDRLLTLDRSQRKVAEELGVICLNPL